MSEGCFSKKVYRPMQTRTMPEMKKRMLNRYKGDTHHYCLAMDNKIMIDAHRAGSECRFVNHSCAPNSEMEKRNVDGLSRMALFALRDILPGEEICYDYNFSLFNTDQVSFRQLYRHLYKSCDLCSGTGVQVWGQGVQRSDRRQRERLPDNPGQSGTRTTC